MNYLFKSKRLGFRDILDSDVDKLYEINSDPYIMRYFLNTLNKLENNGFVNKIKTHKAEYGYTLFSVDILDTNEFIGLIRLAKISFDIAVKDEVEIGWRLHSNYWNMGYAQEGARAVLNYGFKTLNIKDIYAFTAQINLPSQNVMEKIGMEKALDFNHPLVPRDNPLYPHVLYKIDKASFNL